MYLLSPGMGRLQGNKPKGDTRHFIGDVLSVQQLLDTQVEVQKCRKSKAPEARKEPVMKPWHMDSGGETAEGMCAQDWELCFLSQARISKATRAG